MATATEEARTIVVNKVSWGAVFAGVAVALAITIVLNLLGVGVGASVLDPGTADNPDAEVFSGVAAIWWTVSGILASLLGGYVAGRTSGTPDEGTAGYHGIASWATTTLVIFVLLASSAGAVLGGIYNTLPGMSGGGYEDGAGGDPLGELRDNVQKMTGQAPATPAQGAAPAAPADAATADKAATAVSIGSIFAAIALLAGGFAAWVGGCMGAVDPIRTRRTTARGRR